MEWTADTLHDHIEEVLRLRDQAIAARLKEIEKAVQLAREAALREMEVTAKALGHRLENLNDLRKTFEEHEKRGASVAQLDTLQARLEADVQTLQTRLETEIAAIKAQASEMAKRQDQASGSRAGAVRMWGLVTGGVALIAMILGILANLK